MKAGWEVKPLGEVCAKVSTGPFGSILHKKDYVDTGVPLVNPIDMVEGEIRHKSIKRVSQETADRLSAYKMKSGDIAVARRGDLGRCVLLDDEHGGWLCGTGSFFVTPSDAVVSEYLVEYIRSPAAIDCFERASTGATMPNISNKTLSGLRVPIPPLEEQKRIVAVLDAAFEGLTRAKENAEANLQNARELFEASVTALIETTGSNSQEAELGDLIDFKNGFAFKSIDTVDSSGVQLLRMGNLYQNQLDLDRKPVFYPDSFATEFKKFEIRAGDLVMSLTGTMGKEDYGFAVMIPETDRKLLLNQRIAKIEIKDAERLEISYLLILMRKRNFLEKLYSIATGTRQANLSTVQMKKLKIKIPDIQTQRKIASISGSVKASQIDLTTNYRTKLTDIADLRQSLLQKAFAGELT